MFINRVSRLATHGTGKREKIGHLALTILFILAMLGLTALPVRPLQAADCQAYHVVKAGDTLAKIGAQYGLSWNLIAQANGITNPNYIYTGQVLCIPATTTTPPSACGLQHIVQYGETLGRIALNYGLSWTAVAQANNLPNPNFIYAGQRLCIPSVNPPPPPSTGNAVPTFTIISVAANQSVTIRTSNFPANEQFAVRMGLMGTQGINGTYVTNTATGSGGSFTVTYAIPANLRGLSQIAIRLQSPSGYYSYNWFYNNTTN
ncbi:MAG: LysM peptidoglycan-binding domain-containing protein [Ardenticatenaceae bacterium]|nr:LysM peptidoglycan-binding domain-containing protein [Ardenticatenaceae bacterium]